MALLAAAEFAFFNVLIAVSVGFPTVLQCGKLQTHQNGNDRDHDQQFDQRETFLKSCQIFLLYSILLSLLYPFFQKKQDRKEENL